MKRKILLTLSSVIAWIAVAVPAVMLFMDCMYSYTHGTTHGFNGDEMLYGFSAFADTFMFYLCFLFPLFVLWGVLLIAAVSLTIITAVVFKKSARESGSAVTEKRL